MIDSLSSGAVSAQSAQMTGISGMRARFEQAMEPIAESLGMSADDLRSAFSSGQSLAQIATQKGVSSGDLMRVVTQSLAEAGIRAPAGSSFETLVQDLINRPGGHFHSHLKLATGSGVAALGALAGAFGMNEDELVQALQSGTTLLALANQKGVSHEHLAKALGKPSITDAKA